MKYYVLALSITFLASCSDSESPNTEVKSNKNQLIGSWHLQCRKDFSEFGPVAEEIKKYISLVELKVTPETMTVFAPESDNSTKIIEERKRSYKVTNQVGGSYQLEYSHPTIGIQSASANLTDKNVLTIKGILPGMDGSEVVDDKFLCSWVK